MMSVFLGVFSFFTNPFLFFMILLGFTWISLNSYCWGGVFFYFDSFSFILLILMSLFILGIVIISEKSFSLIILSELLVFVCILFFIPVNMIIMYMFFELSMFPILVMILGYGSQIEKINSSYYLIFYAAFCSFPFLFVYFKSNFSFMMVYFDFLLSWEMILILSLSFMMKFPVYFLHLWLPKAHVEAPTTASMLLAGLLLKLGTAGFIRILGSMNFVHINFWLIIAFLGMILASFSCIFQSDSKSLAAYSSVTHMSFLLLSLLFIFMSGKTSSFMMMLSHGYTSTLMFYLIGEFYHSSGSRMIYYMNSFFNSSMLMAIMFSLVFLSNSGVPPSLSFIAEFITISSGLSFFSLSFSMIFVYFVISFYYSIYLITNCVMGKNFMPLSCWNLGFSTPLMLMSYNVFWISMFI
uniref:NADH-ubiquinone oxidoreductase chain 4 n=1 Tax=Steinernema kushidai TaxID=107218 RepID=A0A1E1G7D6_9BILA|nr:NADH dehydrogenase subunit 4 [Steinernema kushidai]